ncbi:uncharacterized protein PpBr36_09549 [Pyricularia pennisetigena]|uniref:uncharacterized protein n=1 Tax=Pyricularia pennisetigena TaxID=1578925 RepID=UPI00114FAD99|nr:uncharacterized protein PpBr36_09549 [Pyricularia pennisetigena]TLS21864.1 hypothetical protein PpBr36_09549 [Pyricularia pennisetigena]
MSPPIILQNCLKFDIYIKVHVLANKYYLDKIKAFTYKKFNDAMDEYYNSENFFKTARESYEMGLLALKTAVVGAFARNYKELLGMENVRGFLEVISKLGINLLLHLHIIPFPLRDGRRKG